MSETMMAPTKEDDVKRLRVIFMVSDRVPASANPTGLSMKMTVLDCESDDLPRSVRRVLREAFPDDLSGLPEESVPELRTP
jgi:hypothetical protein